MTTYIGQHRMGWREARYVRRLERVTVADVLLAAFDWARIPWANMAAAFKHLTTARKPVGGYQICLTCEHGQHAGCGLFDTDPPCGCSCYNAQMGRAYQASPR
jgi:hypothetical protein